MSKTYIIGVAGGSGSGKTTVARNVLEGVGPENVTYIQQDSYYYDLSHLPFDVRNKLNFDHPDAIDNNLLIEHLEKLKRGEPIEKPVYDFKTHTRRIVPEFVSARKVILVEGILILAHEKLRNMMDVKIFVDTASDLRILRRIKRDVLERGRTIESVMEQYLTTIRPMHEQFVAPSKKYADIVILEGGENEVAIDMVITKLKSLISIGTSDLVHPITEK